MFSKIYEEKKNCEEKNKRQNGAIECGGWKEHGTFQWREKKTAHSLVHSNSRWKIQQMGLQKNSRQRTFFVHSVWVHVQKVSNSPVLRESRKPTSHNNNAITACKIKGSHQFTTFIYQFTQNVFYVVCTIFSALIFVMRIFGSLSVDTTTQFRADFDLSLLNYRFAHFQITRGIQINIFFMLVEYEVIFLLPFRIGKKIVYLVKLRNIWKFRKNTILNFVKIKW